MYSSPTTEEIDNFQDLSLFNDFLGLLMGFRGLFEIKIVRVIW